MVRERRKKRERCFFFFFSIDRFDSSSHTPFSLSSFRCRACRGVFPKVVAAAAANPDALFVKLEFEQNKDVCRALGVKALPSFLFYRGADGKLETLVAGPSKAALLADAIERHSSPRCALSEGVRGAPELAALKAQRGG